MVTKKSSSTKTVRAKTSVKKSPAAVVVTRSDNEKAILVALAYLIGFLTAYIAFNIASPEVSKDFRLAESKAHSDVMTFDQLAASHAVSAFDNDEGLFVKNNGVERVVSAKSEDATGPGYHRSIAAVNVSIDGNFVHYCAVNADADSCTHFVYSVDEDRVYPVTSAGVVVTSAVSEASEVFWSETNLLNIGALVSVNSGTPWQVE